MKAENRPQPEITCPLCGTHFSEAEGRACHVECPMHKHCGRLSCPYCAHEVPAPTSLTRWLSRWFNRRVVSDPRAATTAEKKATGKGGAGSSAEG